MLLVLEHRPETLVEVHQEAFSERRIALPYVLERRVDQRQVHQLRVGEGGAMISHGGRIRQDCARRERQHLAPLTPAREYHPS